jgi:hypothetical protein
MILLMASWAEMIRLNELSSTPRPGIAGPNDNLILPGDRVGFITLGLPITEVEPKLGSGRIRPTQRAVLYLFSDVGITCGVEGGRVTFILVHAHGFVLRTGIGVGTDVEAVIRAFGDGYEYDQGQGQGSPQTPAPHSLESSATPGTGPGRPLSPLASPWETVHSSPSPSPKIGTPANSLQTESYTLHYWEKGVHFNVHGSRIESILITAPVGV